MDESTPHMSLMESAAASPLASGSEAAASPASSSSGAASASEKRTTPSSWTTSTSYSGLLSKSMKKIMTTRPRMMSTKAPSAMAAEETNQTSANHENDQELFARFAATVTTREKEEMISLITQTPGLVYIQNADEQLPLHLVCALMPAYFYIDLMEMMVQRNPESPANIDKSGQTPLHELCQNTSVTSQALAVLLRVLPAAAAMRDKSSNLALHYLCMNPTCDLEMLRALEQPDTYHMKNADRRTPLHCLAMARKPIRPSLFLHLLQCGPEAATVIDHEGRAVLHWICEAEGRLLDILPALLASSTDIPSHADKHRDLPLHLLCQNKSIDCMALKRLLQAYPEAVHQKTETDLTPLHLLCANESVSVDLLSGLLAYDKEQRALSLVDEFGATPLHLLCMNEALTASLLRTLMLSCTDASFGQDVHGRSPLHYICMNRAITSELVWLFLERAHDLVREIDSGGKTPLHHLCGNHGVTAVTLEILFDACPSAAVIADKELRLPIQYLVDNPSSPPETTALLISGPSSYRLRYDFLSIIGGHAVSFLRSNELTYIQTSLAMDSKSSSKVMVRFYSSERAQDAERQVLERLNTVSKRQLGDRGSRCGPKDYSVMIYDEFEDAKRRVTIRNKGQVAPEDQIDDASVTLQYGLVLEAPLYTLEAMRGEHFEDIDSKRLLLAEIGHCLQFWHREALAIHGNVSLECIGQFPERGLRLLNCHTSRELHERMILDVSALNIQSCPPEAARAFLAKEGFEPTTASDIWQFGCVIFELASGKALLASLVPWSGHIGLIQLLHLLSALTDKVIEQAINSVDPTFQGLLKATLLVNPAQRRSIDSIMHIDAFRGGHHDGTSNQSSESMRSQLQRVADAELYSVEHQRGVKHAQEQLEFIKKEQQHLRGELLTTKLQLHDSEEACESLDARVVELEIELSKLRRQKLEAQHENQVFARNHQSMTHQLHTTMQMLVNLVPLAKKVYGPSADEFLSSVLSQAAGSETPNLSTIDIVEGEATSYLASTVRPRRKSAVQLIKRQLRNSVLAQGCVHTWANSSPPSSTILEPHELGLSSTSPSAEDDKTELSNQIDPPVEPYRLFIDESSDSDNNQVGNDSNVHGWQQNCFLVETDEEDYLG
ncbi:hypothetical protein Poli38472_005590 [Pythium oligandrum]|uniref:Protein kinase domain-containing protein n=1 Tax=Pythium oligandrum TaxID=41045 RepID=A0A8K1FKM1_PYTOL|nr:hypothetical protein Poli38472_005590 [Pythium oligandrum]|eukprot:TMW62972.1 hypothetical protein Poli38472_005590 [Pythium oligandrum]